MRKLGYFGAPLLVGGLGWLLGYKLNSESVQLIGTAIAVFAALFVGALIPLLELKSGHKSNNNYSTFLDDAIAGILLGFFVAGLIYLTLLAYSILPKDGSLQVKMFLTAGITTLTTLFFQFVGTSVLDVLAAYSHR